MTSLRFLLLWNWTAAIEVESAAAHGAQTARDLARLSQSLNSCGAEIPASLSLGVYES
jgi:hypothetical protein